MKAKVYGFIWKTSQYLSLSDLVGKIIEIQGDAVRLGRQDRLLVLHRENSLVYGLIITTDPRIRQLIVDTAKGETEIKYAELEAAQKRGELNLLVMNTTTGRGLYLFHTGSCGLPSFCELGRRMHDEFTLPICKNENPKKKWKGSPEDQRRKLPKKYKFNWNWRKSGQSGLHDLEGKNTVKYVDFDLYPNDAKGFEYAPPGDNLHGVKIRIAFPEDFQFDGEMIGWVKDSLLDKVQNIKANAGINNLTPRTISLEGENIELCGEHDLDTVVQLTAMKNPWETFGKSKAIPWLTQLGNLLPGWLDDAKAKK